MKDIQILMINKVLKKDGCWFWTGAKNDQGYGSIKFMGNYVSAHRFFYEVFKKKIPVNKVVDHICNNRGCVNPDHLQTISFKENILKGTSPSAINNKKTHCLNGHEFTKETSSIRSDGGRRCNICRKNWYKKQKTNHNSTT